MLNKETLNELNEYVQGYLLEEFIIHEEPLLLESAHYSIDEELTAFIEINRKESLQEVLFTYIERSGLTDPEVYNKAGMDRRLFSKIRSNAEYRPKKTTIISLALALELTKEETNHLLSSAGYFLSDSDTWDLVIQFCLEKKINNLHDVNEALDYFQLKPIMGVK
ncbi:hypothetical protein JOC78_002905 [Bacillus ectoiniformans]|uniref:hypothetical protein n=1 Tax=Bacillus ectoiniformans TaxID=1494429 RepID=UPI00195CF2AC|nr:hypothetical protein [Bacillus ectoiniformans]MBM7649921.1 hypothetical protein [Bacillus ectoiniformans]